MAAAATLVERLPASHTFPQTSDILTLFSKQASAHSSKSVDRRRVSRSSGEKGASLATSSR